MPTKTTTIKKPRVAKKVATKKTVAKKAVAKKAVVKKAATKKTATKKAAVKPSSMVCADGEQCFWMTDGTILRDLEELAVAFGSMADTVFIYHVTPERNDFANWVESVLEDMACAADLRACTTPKRSATVVKRHIKLYV